ncbi:MAG: hypothetical protein CFE44_01405 [Burkholderiales bacterium PBB4]|nr:MAG: hypothetical protein CFE44_01405 [Burkholderiales bacterium PBB4]
MKYHCGARRALVAGVMMGLMSLQAGAQTDASEQACRETVAKFEESMAFVRKSVGYEKAAEIKESLLPNKLESELFAKEGYCGVARHLREKKLAGKK